MPFTLLAIDHVQLAMPPGAEEEGRRFYCGVLGMTELAKPPVLAARGGAWFGSGGLQLHLGVEEGFRPARKAHPAIRVEGIGELAASLDAAGHPVRWDAELPGVRRFYVEDPWGNRIEVLEAVPSDPTDPSEPSDPSA